MSEIDVVVRQPIQRDRSSRTASHALNGLVRCICARKMEVSAYNRSHDDAERPTYVKYRCR